MHPWGYMQVKLKKKKKKKKKKKTGPRSKWTILRALALPPRYGFHAFALMCVCVSTYTYIMGFAKNRGTFLGVPILRNILFWDLYWGSPHFGKLPYACLYAFLCMRMCEQVYVHNCFLYTHMYHHTRGTVSLARMYEYHTFKLPNLALIPRLNN